jgi:hypothetical protein
MDSLSADAQYIKLDRKGVTLPVDYIDLDL